MPEPNAHHRSLDDLRASLAGSPSPPSESGELNMIVIRTNDGERKEVDVATLTGAEGVVGDHWSRGKYADQTEVQVTLINSDVIDAISGGRDRWALAGDNLVVDFDIGQKNLPPGQKLAIGGALLEVSEEPHTGCAKFSKRYGPDALRFVNLGDGPEMRLRGVYARVVQDGDIRTGDRLEKL